MSNTKEDFETIYSKSAKSAKQYFVDQSRGKFSPQFDLYGIYTLSSNRATYGGNDYNGNDKGVAKMVGEACQLAEKEGINWKDYDNDGDGECDVVIVVYAGVGEAQAYGVVPNAVWPCQWQLSDAKIYGDGPGKLTLDGVGIDKFAVFNETRGSRDSGTQLDGIGTFATSFHTASVCPTSTTLNTLAHTSVWATGVCSTAVATTTMATPHAATPLTKRNLWAG